MKKKALYPVFIAAAVVLLAAIGLFFWKYTFAAGMLVERRADTVNMRGRELSEEELLVLREKFPDADILWDVTIGGKTFDGESKSIVTADFTAEDIPTFVRLKSLQRADVSACSNLSAIYALREAMPETEFFWTVPLAGGSFNGESESITVQSASAKEISAALDRLPNLTELTVTDCSLSLEEQLRLVSGHSRVSFVWTVALPEKSILSTAETLDYSGVDLTEDDLATIEKALPLLPNVAVVDLTGCGLSETRLRGFSAEHPGIATVWETELFGVTFSTAAEEIEFTDIPLTVEDAAKIEDMLPYMPNLKKVVMLRCGISNEDMEEINLRYENVQFVWMVQVYSYGVRTDQTYFSIYNCEYNYGVHDRLADELRYCHDMIAVDLGHMHLYGDTYFLTQMPNLQFLILSSAGPDPIPELASCKNLRYLELGKVSFTDITPLAECQNLTDIDLMYKRVKSDEVAESDIETLCRMPNLRRLYIGGNMYSEEQLARLHEALPNTQIIIHNSPEWFEQKWREAEIYFEMRDALHMYYISDEGNHIDVNPYTGERSQYDDTDPFRK